MNISGAGLQYAYGQYAATCCNSTQQNRTAGSVTAPVDPAASDPAASSDTSTATSAPVSNDQASGAVHGHHHHHGHHHGRVHGHGHAGWKAAAGADQASPHAAAARQLDDAVDTLTQQVSATLADLPSGANDAQTQQVTDLQSGFIESIRDVAAQYRVHELGRKDAQAGLQQAFDTLTAGISAIFPDQTAGADAVASQGEASAPVETAAPPDATTSASAVTADATAAVADTGTDAAATTATDSAAAVTASTSAGTSLLQSLEQVFGGVKDTLQSGLDGLFARRNTTDFGNIQDLFNKFVAFYQEMSAAGSQQTDASAAGTSGEVSLVA
jgi:hypothetical protein